MLVVCATTTVLSHSYLMVSFSFLALGFASVLLTAVPPTRSYPTPGLLMDIPSVKTGQQLYTIILFCYCCTIIVPY